MRKPLAVLSATLLLGVGVAAAPVEQAHAAAGDVTYCNHGSSVTYIRIWRDGLGWSLGQQLAPGGCHATNNVNGDMNVDMDQANRGVRSWKAGKGKPGSIVYGGCHEDNPFAFSIPTQWNGATVVFRNYFRDGC